MLRNILKAVLVPPLMWLYFRIEDVLERLDAVEPIPGETEIQTDWVETASPSGLAAMIYLGDVSDDEMARAIRRATREMDARLLRAIESTADE